jgi:acyl-CoA thioesterase
MTHPFLRAAAVTAVAEDRASVTFLPEWVQGRGVYGGVVSAAVVNAALRRTDPRRRLRSLSLSFCAPARPGSATIVTRVVREGALVSTLAAEVVGDDGGVIASALLTCAAPRALPVEVAPFASLCRATMPRATPAAELEPIPVDLPLMPTFAQHLKFRFALGDPPGSSGESRVGAWLRFREPGVTSLDEAVAVGLLDALPPALLSTLSALRPAASVEWHVQFFAGLPRPLAAAEDVLVTAETSVAHEGYAEELDRLWTTDGRLLAQAHQTIALL